MICRPDGSIKGGSGRGLFQWPSRHRHRRIDSVVEMARLTELARRDSVDGSVLESFRTRPTFDLARDGSCVDRAFRHKKLLHHPAPHRSASLLTHRPAVESFRREVAPPWILGTSPDLPEQAASHCSISPSASLAPAAGARLTAPPARSSTPAATRAVAEKRDEYAQTRDEIAKAMTPAQVAEAQARARNWMAAFERAPK
jgi:hypothetical protein